MLTYSNVIEEYRQPRDNAIVALIEETAKGYFVTFNPYSCPCNCLCAFTLEEARETITRLRKGAYISV